ncbi:MAG: RNA polymerase subunit sigma, partial [Chitinophagaceae bacterium]|nr:RNA polymerase subunit sigma [Chitinophagaceae bacterium]
MQQKELIPHLFRTEFSKITAVLCKTFGIKHIEAAEDIASETFLAAVESWTYKGIPPNPVAWLYAVAKNKAATFVKRNQVFEQKIAKTLLHLNTEEEEIPIDLSESNITDSQLQMLFAICNPVIPAASQIGLALRILCGFGIDEIATAFLTGKETINKRLFRAKEKLREANVSIEIPESAVIDERLENVLAILYLLFNEGYYSESKNDVIREELCLEAMRLNYLLLQNPATATPPAKALLALMCFHSSRLAARKGLHGEMILYEDQDTSLWNTALIAKGGQYLNEASIGNTVSTYHLEATIAYWHTVREDTPEKWEAVLQLYDQLLVIKYSPIAAMNRIYALAKLKGKLVAIKEGLPLDMYTSPFWLALMGELYTNIDNKKAIIYFEKAIALVDAEMAKSLLKCKL